MKKPIILTLLGILGLTFIIGGPLVYKWTTAPTRGAVEQRERVQGVDHRIQSYEHFYDLYANYESYKDTLQTQKDVMSETEDKSEKRKIRQNIAAIKSQMARVREQYNADSKKVKTMGQFKSWDLPKTLN